MDIERLKKAQSQAYHMITNSIDKQRLSHAYIFEGDAGTMKFDAALFFAMRMLCDNQNACMECKGCARVMNLTHPNVYIIRQEKQGAIKKESIQALQMEFAKTTIEDGAKIYIIENAEAMNAHAQNALLKFLEEPLEGIHGILLSSDSTKLLPTIQSRAQVIPFHPMGDDIIEQTLIQDGYEHYLAKLASKLVATPEEASKLLDETDLEQLIDIVDSVYGAVLNDKSPLLAFHENVDDVLKDRQLVSLLLEVFIHYQKDLIYGKINNRNQMVFGEKINTIEPLSERFSLQVLTDILEHMLKLNMRQNNYINMRLAFDNLMTMLEKGGAQ